MVNQFKALLSDTRSAPMGIVDEYLRLSGISMERRGHSAQVIAITQGKQGQDGDGAVLQGMQAASKVEPGFSYLRCCLTGYIKPEGDGIETLRRQVKRFLPHDLLSELQLSPEANHTVGHLYLPEIAAGPLCLFLLQYPQYAEIGDIPGLSIVGGIGRHHVGSMRS